MTLRVGKCGRQAPVAKPSVGSQSPNRRMFCVNAPTDDRVFSGMMGEPCCHVSEISLAMKLSGICVVSGLPLSTP